MQRLQHVLTILCVGSCIITRNGPGLGIREHRRKAGESMLVGVDHGFLSFILTVASTARAK